MIAMRGAGAIRPLLSFFSSLDWNGLVAMFKCVIVICVNGEDRHSFKTVETERELRKLATHLDWLVALGKCERYCIMFSGEIVKGY